MNLFYNTGSYRVERRTVMKIALADQEAEIAPVPTDASGHKPEPELERLSNILKRFNEQFGTLFGDTDRVAKRICEDIAPKVAADTAYQNAKENTPHTARMAHDHALAKVMRHLLKDDTQVYKQFVENESFKRFVGDTDFFELRHAALYQGNGRIKINELWLPAAMLIEDVKRDQMSDEFAILRREGRHRLLEGKGIRVFSKPRAITCSSMRARSLIASRSPTTASSSSATRRSSSTATKATSAKIAACQTPSQRSHATRCMV